MPRPETELIVEKIIDLVKQSTNLVLLKNSRRKLYKPLIIDVGTGTGAIVIALAKELKCLTPLTYRRTEFLAVDISQSALKIAAQNAKIHKLNNKIKFYHSNLLASLKLTKKTSSPSISRDLIITANLPYLTPKQVKESPSISREPRLALDGGLDGLKYYKTLFKQLGNTIYRSITIFCEIDPGQAKKITALAGRYLPNVKSRFYKDYSGQNRLFVVSLGE